MPIGNAQARVETTRALTGFGAVLVGDVVIAVAAIFGVLALKGSAPPTDSIVAILSSAFTAIGTLTTAYFGIKATANTAKTSLATNASASLGSDDHPRPPAAQVPAAPVEGVAAGPAATP